MRDFQRFDGRTGRILITLTNWRVTWDMLFVYVISRLSANQIIVVGGNVHNSRDRRVRRLWRWIHASI